MSADLKTEGLARPFLGNSRPVEFRRRPVPLLEAGHPCGHPGPFWRRFFSNQLFFLRCFLYFQSWMFQDWLVLPPMEQPPCLPPTLQVFRWAAPHELLETSSGLSVGPGSPFSVVLASPLAALFFFDPLLSPPPDH